MRRAQEREKPQYGETHWRGSRKRLNRLSRRPQTGRIPEHRRQRTDTGAVSCAHRMTVKRGATP